MAYEIQATLSQCLLELKIEDGAGHSITVQPIVPDSLTCNDMQYSKVEIPHHRGGLWAVVNEGVKRESKKNSFSGKIMDVANSDNDVISLMRILSKLKRGRLDEISSTDVWVSTNPLQGGGCDMLDFTLTGIDANNATHIMRYGASWIDTFDMTPVDGGFNFSLTFMGCEENSYTKED